uniref:CUE domain-containing protein n=1 Tax=Nelumbo nucifera TaxID=4432 RepID=A0A822ZPB5_NELNU|nr:TPA_asm: hypothetical protein HUJ06_002996 [Nelumbo nucifera]
MSSLNPYAASYVPLSKREDADKNAFEISSGSKIVDTDAWSKNSSEGQETEANQLPGEASLDFNVHGIEELLNSMDLTQKSHMDDNSHDSLSCNPSYATEKHNTYDDFEMDLAYLATMFPSLSDQSLVDVYSANAGDLEASVDMLHQLEVLICIPSGCISTSSRQLRHW